LTAARERVAKLGGASPAPPSLPLAIALASGYVGGRSRRRAAARRMECYSEHAMLKIASAVLLALSPVVTLISARAAEVNDYPTEARADFVYVCMKTNGETREALKRCSCSIDVIASLLPYQSYEEAETVASMDLSLGAVGMMFRNSPQAKAMSDDLRRAQAEAEIRCF
jgi:hypothetical protein